MRTVQHQRWTLVQGSLPCLQLLLDNKADLNVQKNDGRDALYSAIKAIDNSGHVFPVLCCNTDAKNVKIVEEGDVTPAQVTVCIEDYKHVQAYIDEYHRILTLVLSEDVQVDPRFGLGQMGIYQEPLERVLEYLGMSMNKD
jgi:hypothetical protein